MPVLQRQTPEDPIPTPDINNPPEPGPKPLIPLGKDWKFDPFVSHPDAPHPWDKPGAGGGAGGSLEDAHKGWNKLFGPKPGLTPLAPAVAPPCSVLMSVGDFKTYESSQKYFHGPLDKEPWPVLTEDQFNQALTDCKKAAPAPQQPQTVKPSLPIPPAGPKGTFRKAPCRQGTPTPDQVTDFPRSWSLSDLRPPFGTAKPRQRQTRPPALTLPVRRRTAQAAAC